VEKNVNDIIKLRVNEEISKARGFLTFILMRDGTLAVLGDTKDLSMKDKCRLEDYHQSFSSVLNKMVAR
jgi:hypothetical protein